MYKYSLVDDAREVSTHLSGLPLHNWGMPENLPEVGESWNRLIGNDLRTVGRWAVQAMHGLRVAGELALSIGSKGQHTGPQKLASLPMEAVSPIGRHTEAYVAARSAEIVRAADLIARDATAREVGAAALASV